MTTQKTVRQILQQKGHEIWNTHPEATVFEALKTLAEKNIGALVVLEDEKFAGLVFVMVSAAVWHFQRQEIANLVGNLVIASLAAFLAYGRWKLKPLKQGRSPKA
jgi:CBS domain-containing protein